VAGAAEGGEEEGMSEKLSGISSSGQLLIKRHNFDPDLIDYIREKEQRITEFLNHAEALEAELAEPKKELEDWKTQRAPRAMLAGEIIRQDWSGHQFDGRSVRTWIREALTGDYVQFDENLKWFDEEYGCTLDDAKKELAEAVEKMTLRGAKGGDEK